MAQNRTYDVQIKFYGDAETLPALARIGQRLGTRSTSATLRRLIEIFDSELVLTHLPGQIIVGHVSQRTVHAEATEATEGAASAASNTRPD